MKVSKGLGTYVGLVTASAQYLGAIALFLEADDQALALGPLATATLTLYKVLDGRFNQATALIENPKAAPAPWRDGISPGDFRRTLGLPPTTNGDQSVKIDFGNTNPYAGDVPAGSVPAEGGQ
jgi:hypothetical protein